MADNFSDFVENYFTVIQAADTIKILSVDLIPKTFFEAVPKDISQSFFDYADSAEAKKVETESVNQRYESNYYDSIYKIYHDLTVISMILVSKFKAGDLSYNTIDEFYNFAVQLLISESGRLQVALSAGAEVDQAPLTELESKLSQDYALITTSFKEPNAEALFLIANKNTALFSSLLKRSSLDERDLGIEHPFVRSVVPPQIEQQKIAANTLGNLSPAVAAQGTVHERIAKDLFHPNWYGLSAPSWLKPSIETPNFSFLPSVDGPKSVVSNELKGLTWVQQVGFKELAKLRSGIEDVKEEEAEEDLKSERQGDKEEAKDAKSEGKDESENLESNGATEKTKREASILNLKNILTYNPAVDEEDLMQSILADFPSSSKQVQHQINKLIVQLNRISKLTVRKLDVEKKIYFKIERLLKFLILANDITPSQLALPISSKIPVTQNNYAGSLPGPLLGNVSAPTPAASYTTNGANIRPGINGYKTNRLTSINKKYRR